MATRKHKKLSNTTMLFIVIAIVLAFIIISGGMPETAEFFKPGKLLQIKIPTKPLAPPLPIPPVQEATTRFAYYNATAQRVYVLDAKDDGTPVGNPYPATRTGLYNPLPSLSHDGQKLIFTSGGVFLTNLSCPEAKSGCPAAQLILPAPAFDPEWSPDDTKILYQAERGIWIRNLALGTNTLAYNTSKLGGLAYTFPTWANFGNNVMFVVNNNLYSMPANCNNACTPASLKALRSDAHPRGYWRGTNVAYWDRTSQALDKIYVRPFDKDESREVIGNKTKDPVWSPNGNWIAFYDISNPSNMLLRRVNADCNQGLGCDVKTMLMMGGNVEIFDWQQIGLSPPLPKAMDKCQVLNQSGTYVLTKDIDASYLGKDRACFNITTSNVVLDCQGHTLTGPYYVGGSDPSGTSSAVFIQGDKNSNTIKNCNIKNFGHGVFMLAGEESIGKGFVEIRSPKNNIVTGNTLTDNAYGVVVTGGAMSCAGEPSGNLVYNNRFFSSQSFYRHAGSISSGSGCLAFAKFNDSAKGNCWDDYSSGGLIPYGTFAQNKKAIITPDSAADYKPIACMLPDLIVKNMTFSANPKVGDTLGATVTVCNIGNAAASEVSFRVIDLAENNGMSGGFAEMPAGDCQTLGSTGWPLTIAGVHTVRAIADSDNEIDESDETNNILEKNITVSGNLTAIIVKDGDAYFCENPDDPNWVWRLSDLKTNSPLFWAAFDQTLDEPDESVAGGFEAITLPNRFAFLYFWPFDSVLEKGNVSIFDSSGNMLETNSIKVGDAVSIALGLASPLSANTKLLLATNNPLIERLSDGHIYMTTIPNTIRASYEFGGSINPPRTISFLGQQFTITSVISNNSFTVNALPACPPRVDLELRNVTFSKTSPKVGDAVKVAATVCNVGEIATSATDISITDRTETKGSLSAIPSLSPGGCSSASLDVNMTTAGIHSFEIKADDSGDVLENDERNNMVFRNLLVRTFSPLPIPGPVF